MLKEELKRAEAWKWMCRGLRRFEKLEERRRKRYLSVPVSSEISLEKALSNLTKDNLTGMARELGVPYGGLRKAELVKEIAGYLKENAKDVYQRLKPKEKEVLRWIVGKGGSASYRGLSRKYGSTKEDSIDWRLRPPKSVVGQLCFKGLLFAGKDEQGKTVAVIPQEVLGQLGGESR